MKKAIVIILSLLLTFVFMSGCTDVNPTESKPGAESQTESTDNTRYDDYGREYIEDSVPEDLRFDGETFTMFVREGDLYELEFYTDEINNEIINDSIYNRNASVEERLGITILTEVCPSAGGYYAYEFNNKVIDDINGGVAAYDAIASYGYYSAVFAQNKLVTNLTEIDYLDFEKPWWNKEFIDEMTVNDKLFYAIGDASFSSIDYTYAMFFNTLLSETYLDTNLYDVVDNKKWTIDYFSELIKDTYRDNGTNPGVVDDGDFFAIGMATASVPLDALFMGFGLSITEKNEDGVPELVFKNEGTVNFFDKIYDLLFTNPGVLPGHYTGESYGLMKEKFRNQETVFHVDTLAGIESGLRDIDFQYGMLPMPMADENQDRYYTCSQDSYSMLSVPITVTEDKYEKIGATLELLAAESYRSLTPAYFEVIMKARYLATDDDSRMYDIVLSGVRYNFGVVNSYSLDNVQHLVRTILDERGKDFISAYEAKEGSVKNLLDELIDVYFD